MKRMRGNPFRFARAALAIACAMALPACRSVFFGALNRGGARVGAKQTETYSESPSLADTIAFLLDPSTAPQPQTS